MDILCSAVVLLFGIITFLKDKKLYNVGAVFSLFWGMILLLSTLRLYGLYEAGDRAYLFIMVGVSFFCLGEALGERITFINRNGKRFFSKRDENQINVRRFYLLLSVCIVCLIPDIKMIIYFVKNGFDLNRIYYTIAMNSAGAETEISNIQFGSALQQIIKTYIGYPLLYLLISVSLICSMKKREKKYFFSILILTLIRFLADLKRTLLVMLFLMVVFFFLLLRDSGKYMPGNFYFFKKFKKRYIFVLFCSFAFIYIIISKLRRGNNEASFSFFENLYYYYVGCVKYFDLRIENWSQWNRSYTLGFFSLRGLISPVFSTLEKLGINVRLFSDASEALASLHNVVYSVAAERRFNSYATAFYEFYTDGGIVGIILGSTIFGWVGGTYYSDYKASHSLLSCLRLGYFISVFILFSMLQISSIINYLVWPLILYPIVFERLK